MFEKSNTDPINQMSTDLQRQRRNLIVLSSVMWFLKYADVKISNFTILGIQFSDFENPQAVFIALWIIWGYFLFRYYLYFMQEGQVKLTRIFFDILDKKSIPTIRKIVYTVHPNDTLKNCTFSSLKNWKWIYHGQIEKNNKFDGIENFQLEISYFSFWFDILKSIFIISFFRSAVMDYILPLALALAIILYCFTGWEGSLF